MRSMPVRNLSPNLPQPFAVRSSVSAAAAVPQENNAAYLKHWLTKLKEEPAFLVEILGDVNKAAKMIADKVTEPINEPAAA